MVGAVAVGIEGAAEVRGGEGGDLLSGAEFDGRVVESGDAARDIGDQVSVSA